MSAKVPDCYHLIPIDISLLIAANLHETLGPLGPTAVSIQRPPGSLQGAGDGNVRDLSRKH